MGTPTYTPLATITLGTAATAVTFSSIPQTYKDLVLVVNKAGGAALDGTSVLRLNGDAGNNYNAIFAFYSGGHTGGKGGGNAIGFQIVNTGLSIFEIMDYSSTDKHKNLLIKTTENPAVIVQMRTTRWASTAEVTSLNFVLTTGTYPVGMTFELYGIAG
jgi:hypothetical protein